MAHEEVKRPDLEDPELQHYYVVDPTHRPPPEAYLYFPTDVEIKHG